LGKILSRSCWDLGKIVDLGHCSWSKQVLYHKCIGTECNVILTEYV
jgi:hypothetical protein